MKKVKSLNATLLLIVLATTVYSSFGQNQPDTTSHFSIKQSQHCFDEQKALGRIIFAKDTIILEQKQKIANLKFLSDTCVKSNEAILKENKKLEDKVNRTKFWNKIIAYTLAIETVVLLTLFLF